MIAKIADWKVNKDSIYITSCIYYALEEKKIDSYEKVSLLTVLPKELLVAVFLFVCS